MIKDRKPLAVLVSAAIVCMAAASCSLNEDSLNRSDTIEVNGRPFLHQAMNREWYVCC